MIEVKLQHMLWVSTTEKWVFVSSLVLCLHFFKTTCTAVSDPLLQAVLKTMEQLAQEGKIREKTYGKQKIYFADQVRSTYPLFTGHIVCWMIDHL